MTVPAPVAREHAVLDLALIDRPTLDARIDRDPEKLEELTRDILRRGLIEPLKVVRVGDRYEVVDGFRRYLACISAGLSRVECFIYPTKDVALEGVKYAANAYREDMSPAEEAIYFHQLFTHECGQDIERVAALVGKKVSYIDNRLVLLNGDELVFAALKNRQIKVGVAHELNRCPDAEYRRYFLRHAILEGSTVTVVAGWVSQWQTALGDRAPAATPDEPSVGATSTSAHDPLRCYICGKSDRRVPETIAVHSSCREAILDVILKRGFAAAEEYETAESDARRI